MRLINSAKSLIIAFLITFFVIGGNGVLAASKLSFEQVKACRVLPSVDLPDAILKIALRDYGYNGIPYLDWFGFFCRLDNLQSTDPITALDVSIALVTAYPTIINLLEGNPEVFPIAGLAVEPLIYLLKLHILEAHKQVLNEQIKLYNILRDSGCTHDFIIAKIRESKKSGYAESQAPSDCPIEAEFRNGWISAVNVFNLGSQGQQPIPPRDQDSELFFEYARKSRERNWQSYQIQIDKEKIDRQFAEDASKLAKSTYQQYQPQPTSPQPYSSTELAVEGFFTPYCKKIGQLGVTNIDNTGYGWRCTPGRISINVDQICKERYGSQFSAKLVSPGGAHDWRCVGGISSFKKSVVGGSGQPQSQTSFSQSWQWGSTQPQSQSWQWGSTQSQPTSPKQVTTAKLGGVYGKLHIDSYGGPLLPGATVSIGSYTTMTDSNGNYTLSGIPAGNQTISFSKSGYKPYSKQVTIIARQNVNAGDNYLPSISSAPQSQTTSPYQAIVRQAYLDILNREPDPGGLQYYTDKLEKGLLNETSLRAELMNSEEYKKKFGTNTSTYQNQQQSSGKVLTVANTSGRGLNLRTAPTLNSSVITLLAEGTRVNVIGGPVQADGYTWWNVSSPAGTGWCVANGLQ